MTRERIKSFELIRAVCTIGIVLYHNSFNYIEYGISGNHFCFNKFASGDWGSLFVAMFFMLSGAVLWYNYGEKINVADFYIKRWLSIFPMFYLAWFVGYLLKVQELGSWLWGGPKKNFIYTILGVDGYFLNPGVNINYYTLGEWFLGAILILYVLFPILRLLFAEYEKTGRIIRYITTVVIVALELWVILTDYFAISDSKNIITCVLDFWIGMLIMDAVQRFGINKNKKLAIAALVLAVIIMLCPINVSSIVIAAVAGALLTMAFMYFGEFAMENKAVSFCLGKISAYSFGIFLVHHVILYAFMKPFSGTEVGFLKSILLFIAVFAIILVVGGLLSMWGRAVNVMYKKIKKIVQK